jgi:hypothetical protein
MDPIRRRYRRSWIFCVFFVTGDAQSGVIMAIMALVLLALVFVYSDLIRRILSARSTAASASDSPPSQESSHF